MYACVVCGILETDCGADGPILVPVFAAACVLACFSAALWAFLLSLRLWFFCLLFSSLSSVCGFCVDGDGGGGGGDLVSCGLGDGVVSWCFDCVLVLGGGGDCVFCDPGDVDASWCSDCMLECSDVVGLFMVSCVCVDAVGVGVCLCALCSLWYTSVLVLTWAFHGPSGGRCLFCLSGGAWPEVLVGFLFCIVMCVMCLGLSCSSYLYCVSTCLRPGPAGTALNLPSIGLYGSLCIVVCVLVPVLCVLCAWVVACLFLYCGGVDSSVVRSLAGLSWKPWCRVVFVVMFALSVFACEG